MLRSLFTGISGLRAHQMMMDVTGNNIANVNTTGFKNSQVTFQDTFSQLLEGASAPQDANQGGTNPSQVGLGVRVAGMSTNFGQGATQVTGRDTDMRIDGEGFFVVNVGGEQMYTRAGSFNFDENGTLVTPEGNPVQGWQAQNDGTIGATTEATMTNISRNGSTPAGHTLTGYKIGADGVITGVFRNNTDGNVIQQSVARIAVATFTNNEGLEKAGSSNYRESVNSGDVTINAPGQGANGRLATGGLEMSNVDLAQEFTNLIISQRGFQANSRVITTSDELLQELVNLKR
ncbi:flagellar hook-basal body complex protein [uncultured Pseudokineococcus sp.]|uniref:flagellar hook-basal body complex protein n=1 Tax=uncultured Pseudokineococcus sp. TaxID=1642928 RepID=UPI0026219CD3|nr:flagellar hook-basal body complex protein [uncultured Pseudokineococcus sp.]